MKIAYINESRTGGFTNPFSDYSAPIDIKDTEVEGDLSDPLYKRYANTKLPILGVKLHNSNTKNKVVFENDRMYAGQYFEAGDIVEVAPYKLMRDEDMYSKSIRECSFTIDKGKGLYALPLGYAICYRNSKETGLLGNIDYEVNEDNNTIKIVAIKRIKRGSELIFDATDEDFANEIQPGQFQYQQGPEPIYSMSNIRIV